MRTATISASEILRALEGAADQATRDIVASLNLLLLFLYEENGRIIVCSPPLEFFEYDPRALTLRAFKPEGV